MKLFIVILFLVINLLCKNSYSQVNCDTIIPQPSLSNYILPYPPGKTFCITQGNCPSVGGHSNLFAYDFNLNIGDTITACRSGIVVFKNEQYSDSDWVNGHENNVFIQHSDGTRMRYTHLKQNGVFVEIGNTIVAGQPLAISGNSGNTGGFPHLHLQAFRDGTSYNGWNSIPLNFSNTTGPINSQNLCIVNNCYPANSIMSAVSLIGNTIPKKFALDQNYPNPFNPSTKINFHLPVSGNVQLKVFDILGNEISVLVNSFLREGIYEVEFNADNKSTGIYFYNLLAGQNSITRRMLLVK